MTDFEFISRLFAFTPSPEHFSAYFLSLKSVGLLIRRPLSSGTIQALSNSSGGDEAGNYELDLN